MGLIEKDCPVGVDRVIAKLQKDLFIELIEAGWRDYESYPRVYINKKGDDMIPEHYKGNGEYSGSILIDDTRTVNSFFIADDIRTYDPKKFKWTQNVAFIIQANVERLYKERKTKNRPDEEMITDVRLAVKKKFWEERMSGIITGVDKVYSGLKISYDKKYFDNMSKFCIARFNFTLLYDNVEKQTGLQ